MFLRHRCIMYMCSTFPAQGAAVRCTISEVVDGIGTVMLHRIVRNV